MTSTINRRQCLILGSATAISLAGKHWLSGRLPGCYPRTRHFHDGFGPIPTHSLIPVVGDGKWIWREPPSDGKGLLEPREFEVRVGITASGSIGTGQFIATTAAPANHPEQEIVEQRFETSGCEASVEDLSETAAQLVVTAPGIAPEQTISGQAVFKVRVTKSYFGYQREQFPSRQTLPRELARNWLGDSPGIETRLTGLQKIIHQVAPSSAHPWDKAKRFQEWVFENIRGVPGDYTSVRRALETRTGDCEERAGVFVALCRASGIPARLVWVPNHAWAEFLLIDEYDQPHWIPVHTAAYSWFGWTGAHEIVLQKGDRIRQSGLNRTVRLVLDWFHCAGVKPKIEFTASITPLPPAADPKADPGPGSRVKRPDGKWSLAGSHPAEKLLRD